MTIITTFDLGHSTEQFREYVSLLFHLAIKGERNGVETTPSERISRVAALTDAYVACRDQPPEATQLDRLSSLILRNELTDDHPDKMAREEYPILSPTQQARRHGDEVSDKWAEGYAVDGRDYTPRTRDYMRKMREIGG